MEPLTSFNLGWVGLEEELEEKAACAHVGPFFGATARIK